MTLVIAERKNGIVTFGSDSRLTLGQAGTFDYGVKIFKIPVKIKGPAKSIEDMNKWEFEFTYGMAVAGSALSSYSIKDSLSEILGNIQYTTNMADLSILGIGTYFFDRYSHISAKLGQVMREGALSEILLGGLCMGQGKTRVLRFYPNVAEDGVTYHWEEILEDDGMYFSGSGKNDAKEIFERHPTFTPLQIIKTVIESGRNQTVGGYLQFGIFYPQDFSLSAVQESIQNDESNEKIQIKHFLGFNLDNQNIGDYPNLFIPHKFVTPEWRHPKMLIEAHDKVKEK